MGAISLDQVKMNVIETAPNGIVNEKTIFVFSEKNNCVTASYSGGLVVQGYLVGYRDKDKLFFSYCQLQTDKTIDNGRSECDLIISDNGKIKLIEKFMWTSKENEPGVNIFQEL